MSDQIQVTSLESLDSEDLHKITQIIALELINSQHRLIVWRGVAFVVSLITFIIGMFIGSVL